MKLPWIEAVLKRPSLNFIQLLELMQTRHSNRKLEPVRNSGFSHWLSFVLGSGGLAGVSWEGFGRGMAGILGFGGVIRARWAFGAWFQRRLLEGRGSDFVMGGAGR